MWNSTLRIYSLNFDIGKVYFIFLEKQEPATGILSQIIYLFQLKRDSICCGKVKF
jgi:hypothetical protein